MQLAFVEYIMILLSYFTYIIINLSRECFTCHLYNVIDIHRVLAAHWPRIFRP